MLERLASVGFLLFVTSLMIGAASTPAHAYLDPGTGSMILQVVLGGVAGIAVAGRFYWHRLRVLLGIEPEAAKTTEAVENEPARAREPNR